MAASSDGPPSGAAAILSASLGYLRYVVSYAAKVADLPSSTFPSVQVGGRALRDRGAARSDQPPLESAQTRLINADLSYTERHASVLENKIRFGEHLAQPCLVHQGDVIPYHFPDTVELGVDENVAIVVDLIYRAGGYHYLFKSIQYVGTLNYEIDITLAELTQPCVFSYSCAALPSHTYCFA